VLPVLLEVLDDADPQCRRMAAQAIGLFGRQAHIAIPALTVAANDSDSSVQRLAKEALERIENGLAPKQSPTGKNNSR
jgi:HEAT repeat protein